MGLGDSVYQRLLKRAHHLARWQVGTITQTRSCAQLLLLAAEDPERDIYLCINSPGGSVTAGMACLRHHAVREA